MMIQFRYETIFRCSPVNKSVKINDKTILNDNSSRQMSIIPDTFVKMSCCIVVDIIMLDFDLYITCWLPLVGYHSLCYAHLSASIPTAIVCNLTYSR